MNAGNDSVSHILEFPNVAKLTDFELRTAPGLWRWYEQSARQLAFRAQPRDAAEAWQQTLRNKLTQLLGLNAAVSCDLDAHLIESVEADGIRRELVVLQVQPGEYMPCYIL